MIGIQSFWQKETEVPENPCASDFKFPKVALCEMGSRFSDLSFFLRTMGTKRTSFAWPSAHLFFWPPPVMMER